MTPNLKAALQASLKQEDEAVKARLQEPVLEATPAKTAKAPVKRVSSRKPKPAPAAEPAKMERAKPAVKKDAPAKPARIANTASKPKLAPVEAKAVKVSRESFSLQEGEAATLKSLRTAVAKEGRITTKSELVRAGIKLLTGLQSAQLIATLDGLPLVVKKKKKK